MKGGQSKDVGSRESQRDRVELGTKRGECEGGLEGWGFGGAQVFSNYVEVTKGSEQ